MGYKISVHIPGHGVVVGTCPTIEGCWEWYHERCRPDVATLIVIEQL